jgi:hypothetical protein
MRIKYTVGELLREQAGSTKIRQTSPQELRWQWLDYFILPRPELLELTAMPKGRFESYLRRHLLDLHKFGAGMGNHVHYKPLEAMKLMAIDGLAQAGAWDWCVYQTFRHNGHFDSAIRGYQFRLISSEGRPEAIIMNTPLDRYWIDNPGRTSPYRDDLALNLAHIHGEWPPNDWYRLEFDVAAFIEMTVPKVIAFLQAKGAQVEDC